MSSRERFEEWWQDKFHNGNPPRGGWDLYREGDDYSDEELDGQWCAWQASRQALEIALPVLEQQEMITDSQPVITDSAGVITDSAERGEGWIEWGGRSIPKAVRGRVVQVRYESGEMITEHSGFLNWGDGVGKLVCAYRIIPERATNQSGEQ
ncbi:hypothetical protein [Pantoea brenneri]|uniref:hypothetical protein n=1 Tax=Pantoea brenneri TaxID=472694 RepID=UPI0028969C15|nr:hypothetical protein [Pantoea brenneri]